MDPSLCANGCGFFGSSETKNLCSKCYKDQMLQVSEDLINSLKFRELSLSSSASLSETTSVFDHEDTKLKGEANNKFENEKKKKNRCKICNKKVGLTGFECRCGDLFCGKHRYPEEHSCTVDFKGIGRQILIKNNPLIKADKLNDTV